jgi:hypothetical protein
MAMCVLLKEVAVYLFGADLVKAIAYSNKYQMALAYLLMAVSTGKMASNGCELPPMAAGDGSGQIISVNLTALDKLNYSHSAYYIDRLHKSHRLH